MKILILTMTAGEGHNSIARALSKQFNDMNIENKIYDIYSSNIRKFNINSKGYLLCYKFIPHIYATIWTCCKKKNYKNTTRGVFLNELKPLADANRQMIEEYKPDAIVCTTNYASGLVCYLKNKQLINENIKIFSLLTDFLPHPFWEYSRECDYILTPDMYSYGALIDKGFCPINMENDVAKIAPVGFTLNENFTKTQNTTKKEIRNKLGLQDKFTVMMIGGGFGIGKNAKLVKHLLKHKLDIQIISVGSKNAKNVKKVAKLIKKHNATNVANYGYVDEIVDVMDASDCIVSRGGCSTLNEAIARQLPIITRENLRINEKENALYLEKLGIAIKMKHFRSLHKIISDLQEHPEKLERMRQNCANFTQKDSTQKICDFIIEHSK